MAMAETARIQTPYLVPEDELDRSLRPRRLDDFVGQETLREQLAVAIEACGARGSRWISSTKKTLRGSRAVRNAATSPLRSSAGPAV